MLKEATRLQKIREKKLAKRFKEQQAAAQSSDSDKQDELDSDSDSDSSNENGKKLGDKLFEDSDGAEDDQKATVNELSLMDPAIVN